MSVCVCVCVCFTSLAHCRSFTDLFICLCCISLRSIINTRYVRAWACSGNEHPQYTIVFPPPCPNKHWYDSHSDTVQPYSIQNAGANSHSVLTADPDCDSTGWGWKRSEGGTGHAVSQHTDCGCRADFCCVIVFPSAWSLSHLFFFCLVVFRLPPMQQPPLHVTDLKGVSLLHYSSKMNEKNKTLLKKKKKKPPKTKVSYCFLGIEGFGIWISKRTVRGFLCTLSAVCDSGRGTILHPMESPILSRESAQPFAPLKKRICSATRTRTLSLNINNICLVTKHELSMGRSTAAEWETCQARERSAVHSDGWNYGGRIKRCGKKFKKKMPAMKFIYSHMQRQRQIKS